jgi:hypothetical protein
MSFQIMNIPQNAPVGTIVAITTNDTTLFPGWLICNGESFSAQTYTALNDFLGSNITPNLNAAFLRGTGNVSYNNNSYDGPNIKEYQGDTIKNHNHIITYNLADKNGGGTQTLHRFSQTSGTLKYTSSTPETSSETAPLNYGIYWIIKA